MFNWQRMIIKKKKYEIKTNMCYRRMCKNILASKGEKCYGKLKPNVMLNDDLCLRCKHFYKNNN